jgi:hypothetical protein
VAGCRGVGGGALADPSGQWPALCKVEGFAAYKGVQFQAGSKEVRVVGLLLFKYSVLKLMFSCIF